LLVGSDPGWGGELLPVWLLPLGGGPPRRLGDAFAKDAAWCANGQIIFADSSALYSIASDGTGARKIAEISGQVQQLACSPSSRAARFRVRDPSSGSFSLWEVSLDTAETHPLLNGWRTDREGEWGGAWTRDGKYYLFTSTSDFQSSLWAIREKPDHWYPYHSRPMALYEGAHFFAVPTPDVTGNRLFIIGAQAEIRELTRFDPIVKRTEPYLSGIAARWVRFSRDRQWVAYIDAHDYTLWRSRADGTERLQLTFSPCAAFTPIWSSDGKQLAFVGSPPGQPRKIYLVSRDGGLPHPVSEEGSAEWNPNWSADSKALLFGRISPSYQSGSTGIYELSLKTGEISLLPGSDALTKPSLSPDGRYLAALTSGGTKLFIRESGSKTWVKLAEGAGIDNVFWSRDGRYVYFQDFLRGRDQTILRVRLRNRRVEEIASREQLFRSGVRSFSLTGLAPDDSLLITIVSSKVDIYQLSVNLP
jgi:Tol biopolymer transport system component